MKKLLERIESNSGIQNMSIDQISKALSSKALRSVGNKAIFSIGYYDHSVPNNKTYSDKEHFATISFTVAKSKNAAGLFTKIAQEKDTGMLCQALGLPELLPERGGFDTVENAMAYGVKFIIEALKRLDIAITSVR